MTADKAHTDTLIGPGDDESWGKLHYREKIGFP